MDETGEGDGRGANINIPLPPGSGHGAYLEVIDRVVVPALEKFGPELVVIASGFDANAFDPLGRMLCTSDTYREMTRRLKTAADGLCGGKLVVCQEGGYSPAYMPYCALAVAETLSGIRTQVEDARGQSLAFMGGQDLQPHQSEVIGRAAAMVSGIPRP
jgi:acetoin utilization deacetylase AcuC-like enzyme